MKAAFARRTKAALAVAGLLAIVGAVGSAIAMSPIITPPIKWAGGAEFAAVFSGGPSNLYTVPAGRSLIVTDLIVANTTGAQQVFTVLSGSGGTCASPVPRLIGIVVPAGQTAYASLQTGIGFASGTAVCVVTTGVLGVNGRGFLFTAAPAG